MRIYLVVILSISTAMTFAVVSGAAQWTHPVHGHEANSIFDSVYGEHNGYPAEYSMGDITFDGPGNHPPASSLTAEEKYIVAGATTSDYGSDAGLQPWTSAIFGIVNNYYSQYGTIPATFTDVEIRKVRDMENASDSNLREFLNPLTDQWPRLNAATPSPGDVYIRPLSLDEMRHYAQLVPSLNDAWFNGRSISTETGELASAELTSQVYYMRVYGWNGVIFNNFQYALSVEQ